MMEEYFFSGYCRTIDASRMVAVEAEDGNLDVDCCYGNCPYEKECTIAKSIRKLQE